jgi:hypothetical protein
VELAAAISSAPVAVSLTAFEDDDQQEAQPDDKELLQELFDVPLDVASSTSRAFDPGSPPASVESPPAGQAEPVTPPHLDQLTASEPTASERMPRLSPAPRDVELAPLRANQLVPDDVVAEFNGRNCPEEVQTLQAAWETLRGKPLSAISLDITPSVEPNGTPEEVEASRSQNMADAPSRIWRNRQGEILAEGRMHDFQHGKVLVETASGQRERLSWYDLSNADLCFVSAWWELPSEFSPAPSATDVRNWTMSTLTWAASGLCHKPLYFEEVQLERYGHSACPTVQAALSGVHFFGNVFFLPYHMGVNPPNECQYALGYYRPGSCAPWMVPAVPLSARGARWQLAAVTGGLIWLP